MMSEHDSQNDMSENAWGKCPVGELQRMVGRLNFAEHCAKRRKLCLCGATAMLLIAGTVVLGGTFFAMNTDSLTCTACRSHFESYYAYLTGVSETGVSETGDTSLAKQMETHLARCKPCWKKFNTAYPGMLASDVASSSGRTIRWNLPAFAVVGAPEIL